MNHNHRNRQEDTNIKESVRQFEAMLSNEENHFLEEVTYESLSDYYFLNGKVELAKTACDMGISHFPYSLQLQLMRAELHIAQYEFDTALELLDKVSTLNPSDTEISFLRGVTLDLIGDYEQAVEVFREILPLSADKDAVYFQLGMVFQHTDEFDKASHCFRKAVAINPENEGALFELVFCLEQTDEIEEYLPFLKELTEKDPFAFAPWFCLGMCYNQLVQTDAAIEAYEYAVAIKDDFVMAWFNLGHIYMNTEQFLKAQEVYQKVVDIEQDAPNAESFVHLASSYEKTENFADAYVNYRKATELDEQYADAWYGMASVLYEEGKSLEAIHFVQKAIKLQEMNADYWLLLADTEAQLGNFMSAVEAYGQSVDLDPLNADTWLNWSLLYWEIQEYDKAFGVISDALAELPDEADLHYRATVYLVFAGNYNDGYKYLDTALSLDYDAHTQIYDFFTNLETQKALFRIIQQYK